MQIPKPKKTTKKHLRDLFNAQGFHEALLKRTTQTTLCYDEIAPEDSGEPQGTMSQIHDYIDGSGNKIATIHKYRRSDGTVGGSGLLDPHSLLIEGVLFCDP
jgi:hypothetical protein